MRRRHQTEDENTIPMPFETLAEVNAKWRAEMRAREYVLTPILPQQTEV